jgi:hypothetical protein
MFPSPSNAQSKKLPCYSSGFIFHGRFGKKRFGGDMELHIKGPHHGNGKGAFTVEDLRDPSTATQVFPHIRGSKA